MSRNRVVIVNGQPRSLTHTELVTIGLSCMNVSTQSDARGGKMIDIEDVKTLSLKPGQILVVKLTKIYPIEAIEPVVNQIKNSFPNNQVWILDSDIELMVIDNE